LHGTAPHCSSARNRSLRGSSDDAFQLCHSLQDIGCLTSQGYDHPCWWWLWWLSMESRILRNEEFTKAELLNTGLAGSNPASLMDRLFSLLSILYSFLQERMQLSVISILSECVSGVFSSLLQLSDKLTDFHETSLDQHAIGILHSSVFCIL
jgi:hypothetical protein